MSRVFLSIVLSVIGLNLFSQNDKTVLNLQQSYQTVEVSGAKASFIKSQDYLSSSSMKDYRNDYGDSLKGFDETAIKARLIGSNVYGQEYINYIKILKRNFVNEKYGIGQQAQRLQSVGTNNALPALTAPGKVIGGNNVVNAAPCVNEDFELTPLGAYTTSNAVAGWTVLNQMAITCGFTGAWAGGSTEFSIVTTPIINFPGVGTIPNSPLGGSRVAWMNDMTNNSYRTKLRTSFPVTTSNSLFQFAFAGVYEDAGHQCCEQPGFYVQVLNCNNQVLSCSSITLSANCPAVNATFTNGTTNFPNFPGFALPVSWTNWQVKYIDLSPYIGSCVSFECWTTDCIFGGHRGSTLFDARCGGQLVGTGLSGVGGNIPGPVSFCAGTGIAQIAAPLGYASYTWVAPPGSPTIPASQASLSIITITNPVQFATYTVNLLSPSGCAYTSTNQIISSTVSIVGIGTTTTCLNGASGSATVQGNGNGAGYTYTWTNSNNVTVGSSSVVTGLPAGNYSVTISGIGGCGTASTTATISPGPQALITVVKPFCGAQAYLITSAGSNFKWYNNTPAPVSGTAGTAPTYTVSNPVNGQSYYLSYLSNLGCRDSVKFLLASTPPGITVVQNSSVCPGGTNGTATVTMIPAATYPWPVNSFSLTNSGTNAATYNASIAATTATVFTVGSLSAGSYSVKSFDGSCSYLTNFNVSTFNYNYTITPQTASLCPNNTIVASVNFGSPPFPGQYSYSWTPSTWLIGGTSSQNGIISSSLAPGSSSTVVYSVTVVPGIIYCPTTKTIAITSISPAIPTITPIPDLCDNSAPYTIQVLPPGGTFNSGPTAPPIGGQTGVLSPTLALIGTNTFTYSIMVNTCVVTKSASYVVSKFNTSALTSSIQPLCVTNPAFNLMNIVQSTVNGSWSGIGVTSSNLLLPANLQTNNYVLTYSTFSSPNQTVCPSTTTINVSVTNTITPAITQVPPFCTNASTFVMNATPAGGAWGGNPAISAAGSFSPLLSSPNTNVVGYTVNIGPCVNTNTIPLNISQFNTAAFSSTIPNLCGLTNTPFNLMTIVQSTVNGNWSSPQGVSSNSFFPASMASNTYALTYGTTSTPNATLCPDTRTIAVSVLKPPVPIITHVGPYCSRDAAVQLSVTPDIGSWVASGYINSAGILTPSLCSVGNNPVQYVIGTNTCYSQHIKYISVEAFNSAAITSKILDMCNTGSPLNLLPFTLSNQGAWSGLGISGTSFNPATAGAGVHLLSYTTASYPSGLCPDHSTVAVNVYSLAAPGITDAKQVCNSSAPFKLQVSPVGGLFGGANTTAVSLNGAFNPAAAVIGGNIVNYSITSGPCVAYAQTTIQVERFVSADVAKYPKAVYCQTIDHPVNMEDFVFTPGGTWAGPGMNGNIFDPLKANVGANNFILYTTHSIPTATLCPDTTTIRMVVGNIPVISAKANVLSGCAPLEVVLTLPDNEMGTATWILGDGSEFKNDRTISHIYTSAGQYTAALNYVSPLGCPAELVYVNPSFTVFESPLPNFNIPDEVFISNPNTQVINLTHAIGFNKYSWSVDGLKNSNEVNPVLSFNKAGRYNVTLVAENVSGCKAEITKPIEIKNDFNVFIPSSFSPNSDGINDAFFPVFSAYGLDVKSYEMEVFDRWGHSLYRTKDHTRGWDGTVNNKGESLKEEVYVYKIRYKDLDGNSYNKIGHVTLLK